MELKKLKIEAKSVAGIQSRIDDLLEKYKKLIEEVDAGNVENVNKRDIEDINISSTSCTSSNDIVYGNDIVCGNDLNELDDLPQLDDDRHWDMNSSGELCEIPQFSEKVYGGECKSDKLLIKNLRTNIRDLENELDRKNKVISEFDKMRSEIADKMERIYVVSEERKLQLQKLKKTMIEYKRKKHSFFS